MGARLIFLFRKRCAVQAASELTNAELFAAVWARGFAIVQRKWEIIPNSLGAEKQLGDRVQVRHGHAEQYAGENGTVTYRQDAPKGAPGNDYVRIQLDSGRVISSKSIMLYRIH